MKTPAEILSDAEARVAAIGKIAAEAIGGKMLSCQISHGKNGKRTIAITIAIESAGETPAPAPDPNQGKLFTMPPKPEEYPN